MNQALQQTSIQQQHRAARSTHVQSALEAWDEVNERADGLQRELDQATRVIDLQNQRIDQLTAQLAEVTHLYKHHERLNHTLSARVHSIATLFNDMIQSVKDGMHAKLPQIVPVPPQPKDNGPELSPEDEARVQDLAQRLAPDQEAAAAEKPAAPLSPPPPPAAGAPPPEYLGRKAANGKRG